MDYQNYPSYPGEVVDAEYVEIVPSQSSMGTGLLPRRTSAKIGRVVKEAMVQRTHDQCQALLAQTGMEHIAALSAMEQQFTSMTPQSAERYRAIVDAYAQQAVDRIRRW